MKIEDNPDLMLSAFVQSGMPPDISKLFFLVEGILFQPILCCVNEGGMYFCLEWRICQMGRKPDRRRAVRWLLCLFRQVITELQGLSREAGFVNVLSMPHWHLLFPCMQTAGC